MVKLIFGKVGAGKTKRLIELANKSVNDCNGDIVYMQHNNRHMLDLNHKIRFINAMDFDIKNIDEFHGFLCGIISEDYDIKKIFIDEIYQIIELDYEKLSILINKLEKLANKYDIEFRITMSRDPKEVPEEFNKYII